MTPPTGLFDDLTKVEEPPAGGTPPSGIFDDLTKPPRRRLRKPQGTVTTGQPVGIGIPASEVARLRTTGTLADRIAMTLRAAPAMTANPALAANVAKEVDRQTPMSLPRGVLELATAGMVENATPTAGAANADYVVEKLARSGVDVSKHANLLGASRAAGAIGGAMALSGPAAAAQAPAGATRAGSLIYKAMQGGAQNASLAAEGSLLEGDDLKTGIKNTLMQGAMGAATAGAMTHYAKWRPMTAGASLV